nr:AlpA family phage regulatory protein [Collimonas arenae]
MSPATIWRWLREEKNGFPKPFKLSEGVTAWDADEIDAFIARCAGVSA